MTSLRKGRSSVYLQYDHVGESIDAEEFCAEESLGIVTLRFTLRPSGNNQLDDEVHLHELELRSVQIDDPLIGDRLLTIVRAIAGPPQWRLEIESRGKVLAFAVKPEGVADGGVRLDVSRADR